MELLFRISAICVIGSVLGLFFKKNSPDLGLVVTLSVCVAVLASLIAPLREILELLRQMIDWSGLQGDIFTPLLKTLGIGLVCRLGGDLCRDAGQCTIASLVETGGALGTILVAAPLLRAVWEMLQSLL